VLIWSIPYLSLSLSLSFSLSLTHTHTHTHTHTEKRMLSHLIVNSNKMERLLSKLWIYSSWPISSHRKRLQYGVFWNLKFANCCNNNPIPQFVACQSLRNQTQHQRMALWHFCNSRTNLRCHNFVSSIYWVFLYCSFTSVPHLSHEIPHVTIRKVGFGMKMFYTYSRTASILSILSCSRNADSKHYVVDKLRFNNSTKTWTPTISS
jgi:hypothetical protein